MCVLAHIPSLSGEYAYEISKFSARVRTCKEREEGFMSSARRKPNARL